MRRGFSIRSSPEKIEFLEKTTLISAKNYEVVFSFAFYKKIRLFCVAIAIFKGVSI